MPRPSAFAPQIAMLAFYNSWFGSVVSTLQVMLLVADGLANKDVGRRLNVSEGTVKVHLHSIYQKVAVNNRTALAKFAGLYRDRIG
jgi:ATP/maltotriose-dependent transcriptional regulator MalT